MLGHAHGSVAGFGGFAGGFLHPLFDLGLLLAVLACALVLGQHGLASARLPAACGIGGLAVGLLAGLATGPAGFVGPLLLVLVAAAGALVASGRCVPGAWLGLLLAALGAGLGLGAEPTGASRAEQAFALAGSFVGTCIWAADGALLVQALKKPWGRVLVRVAGSWLAACALLVLALQLAPPRPVAAPAGAPPASSPGHGA